MATVAAVLLAAGASSRFGSGNKLLAEIGGRPLVRITAEAVLASGIAEVLAVTGADAELIEQALAGLPLRCVHNATWQRGLGSSLAAGISALGKGAEGSFIVPGDMPLLSAGLLRSLIEAFGRHGRASIVYPVTAAGEQRNPVLFPRRFFPELSTLSGPEGAKPLLRTLSAQSVAVSGDAAAFTDIDTPADLDAVIRGCVA